MRHVFSHLRYQVRYALPIWLALILTSWLPDNRISIRVRGGLVALFLPGRPKRLTLGRDVTLLSVDRLVLGSDVYIAKGCWINAIGRVHIGPEVNLAPYVVVASSNHGFRDGSVAKGGSHPSPIAIGFGSWIGAHACITAGSSIGSGNVVGANAVVSGVSSANLVLAGVPARVIKEREDNPSNVASRADWTA